MRLKSQSKIKKEALLPFLLEFRKRANKFVMLRGLIIALLSFGVAKADWFADFGKEQSGAKTVQVNPVVQAHFDNMVKRLKHYNTIYPEATYWSKTNRGTQGVELYIDISTIESVKLLKAFESLKERMRLDSGYAYLANVSFNVSPVIVSRQMPYAHEYLNKGMAYMIVKDLKNEQDLLQAMQMAENVNFSEKKDVEKWLKNINVDLNTFYKMATQSKYINRADFYQKALANKTVKDIPIVYAGKFLLNSNHIRKANETQLIDLLDYIAILSTLDGEGLLSLQRSK